MEDSKDEYMIGVSTWTTLWPSWSPTRGPHRKETCCPIYRDIWDNFVGTLVMIKLSLREPFQIVCWGKGGGRHPSKPQLYFCNKKIRKGERETKTAHLFRNLFWPAKTEGVESTRGNSVCVCLSVITFSLFEYSIIWWFRPCNPYIFWKLIMLASSTAPFWPRTTEYQPVPPSIDPVFNDLMV